MGRIIRRYNSEIYGRYRWQGVLYGVVTGLLLSVYVLVRHLIGNCISNPVDVGKDVLMVVAMVVAAYLYRRGLDGGKVTLKELMLMGLWCGVVAAVVYGLFIWIYCGVLWPEMAGVFAERFGAKEMGAEAYEALTNPVGWALFYGFVYTACLSIIVAFFTALALRTTKGEQRV